MLPFAGEKQAPAMHDNATPCSLPASMLPKVILRILWIEVRVCDWRIKVNVLVPVILYELVILVINLDPYQDFDLDILVDDKPPSLVSLYLLLWEIHFQGSCVPAIHFFFSLFRECIVANIHRLPHVQRNTLK